MARSRRAGLPDRPAAGLARARQPARLPRAARRWCSRPTSTACRPTSRSPRTRRRSAAAAAATPRGSRPRWWPRPSGWRPPGERRIGLLFLVGEENGSDGARVAADLGPRGRFLINGEPTENRLSIGQKGSLRVDLHATGRAAHSAYPDEGDERHRGAARHASSGSARMPLPTDPAAGLVDAQRRAHPRRRRAQRARARGDAPSCSSAPSVPTDGLKTAIRALAAPGVSVDVPGRAAVATRAAAAPAGWETTVVSYASDLPFLTTWGECYQLGPGTIRVAHTRPRAHPQGRPAPRRRPVRPAGHRPPRARGVMTAKIPVSVLGRHRHGRPEVRPPARGPPLVRGRGGGGVVGERGQALRRRGALAGAGPDPRADRRPHGAGVRAAAAGPDRVRRARRRGRGADRAGVRGGGRSTS